MFGFLNMLQSQRKDFLSHQPHFFSWQLPLGKTARSMSIVMFIRFTSR